MKNNRLKMIAGFLTLFAFTACEKDHDLPEIRTADFETLPTGNSLFWNGSDRTGKFVSGDLTFVNTYNPAYGSWDGFAYSQKSDVTTADFSNQFSVFDAGNGLNKFALFYPPYDHETYASFPSGIEYLVKSISVCNSTYAALTMKNGDGSFSKKFGGPSGNDKDWFKLTIIGFNAAGDSTNAVNFLLADYRSDNNANDVIISEWTSVDLSPLGKINKLTFRFSSTDNSPLGMNNPAYVCLDNVKYEVVVQK